MDVLSATQKLWEDGYAVIEDFLNGEEIQALKNHMHEIVDGLNPKEHQTVFSTTNHEQTCNDYFMNSGDKIAFFFEEGALDKQGNLLVEKHLPVNKIGHALHCLDPVFSKITQSERIKDLARVIGFTDPVIPQSLSVLKQPQIGSVVNPHQDSTFLNTNPKRLVGVWIPLEDAKKENGCLWFIQGSHKSGVDNERYLITTRNTVSGNLDVTFTNLPDDNLFVPSEMRADG